MEKTSHTKRYDQERLVQQGKREDEFEQYRSP
jgi:hypothetical protein